MPRGDTGLRSTWNFEQILHWIRAEFVQFYSGVRPWALQYLCNSGLVGIIGLLEIRHLARLAAHWRIHGKSRG